MADQQHQGEQQQLYQQGEQQLKYEDEGDVREVTVKKEHNKPLGATIRKDGEHLVISRIVNGGVCDSLRIGDKLLSVDGRSLRGMTVNEASSILGSMSGQLIFSVLSDPNLNEQTTRVVGECIVRALFSCTDYDVKFNPCKELRMTFKPGDVIHVVNKDDPNLWQGFKDGEQPADLAKILPSPKLLKSLKTKGSGRFYERQGRFVPQSGHPHRTLVLVGSAGCGHHELWANLIESYPNTFASAVPHTTRQRRPEELDGIDYWFVDREQFKRLQMIETSEFNGDLYGTNFTSVQDVAKKGMVCVLTLQPESLETLRSHGARLLPYVVFVRPPSFDQLRELRSNLNEYSELAGQEPLTDKQIRDIISRSKKIEKAFGHMFDSDLVLTDLEAAHTQLAELTSRLQTEPQWMPASWLQTEPGQLPDTEFPSSG